LLSLFIIGESFFYCYIILFGQPFQCIYIAVLLMLHDEADWVATFATTKTLINLFAGRYSERRRFFVVKRTKAQVTGTPLLKFYKFADHIEDVNATKYLLYRILGNHAGLQI
jgi:hypothetical protein